MSRRAKSPSDCGKCHLPVMWAHDERGNAIPVEAHGLSDDERCEQPRFDPSVHQRHQCTSWIKVTRSQVGAVVTVDHGPLSKTGELLACDGDYLVLKQPGNRVSLVPLTEVACITFGVPENERADWDRT